MKQREISKFEKWFLNFINNKGEAKILVMTGLISLAIFLGPFFVQTNIIDNTSNRHSLTLKKTNFCNFMERVTNQNIQKFYDGSNKIFRVNPLNGEGYIYRYVHTEYDYIIVRKLKVLQHYLNEYGDIVSLTESEILNCNFYFYENEKQVLEKQIEWHEKEINRLQNTIDTII